MAKMSGTKEEAERKVYVMARVCYELVNGFRCSLLVNGICEV